NASSQIWFQNRRQTNRRKAKPLLAHELVPNADTDPPSSVSSSLSSDPLSSSEADAVLGSSSNTMTEPLQANPIAMSQSSSSDMDSPMSDIDASFESIGHNVELQS